VATTERIGRDHRNDFDIDCPEFNENYDQVIADLVEKCPVARSEVGHGYWLVNRYDDIRRVAQDWLTFSSAKGFQPNRPEGMAYLYPEESDPPYHNRWRTTLNPFLSPTTTQSKEDAVRGHANELIDQFVDKGRCDWVSEFAVPLPGRVWFADYLGISVDDLPPLQKAIDDALVGPLEGRAAGWTMVGEYMANLLMKRAEQPPRGDLIDVVLKGQLMENDEACPFEHMVSVITDLTAGGIGTTTYLLSGMVYHLATHPEDQQRLRDDPSLHSRAVEEFIRFYAPVVALARTATKDTEIAGQPIKEGDWVMLHYAAGSRDPSVVGENPHRVDIDRELTVNGSFGFGVHRCIGSNLARVEARVVLQEVLRRLPEFSISPGEEVSYSTGVTRFMDSLPLIWRAA
jgi:cytochrome P450